MIDKDIAFHLIVMLTAMNNGCDYDSALDTCTECAKELVLFTREPDLSPYRSVDDILRDYLGLSDTYLWVFIPE